MAKAMMIKKFRAEVARQRERTSAGRPALHAGGAQLRGLAHSSEEGGRRQVMCSGGCATPQAASW